MRRKRDIARIGPRSPRNESGRDSGMSGAARPGRMASCRMVGRWTRRGNVVEIGVRTERAAMQEGHNAKGHNANGAGIAADPTLTSAWSSHLALSEDSGPSGKRLAPDVSPSIRQAGLPVPSPALAPASGPASVSHPIRRPAPRRLRRAETDQSLVAVHLERFRYIAEASRVTSMASRNVRPAADCFSRPSRTVPLLPVETFCRCPSRTARTDPLPHPGLENYPGFRPLGHHPERLPCPSDELRLRLRSESFKFRNPDFSTFPRFRCGHGWISQRFVAPPSSSEAIG